MLAPPIRSNGRGGARDLPLACFASAASSAKSISYTPNHRRLVVNESVSQEPGAVRGMEVQKMGEMASGVVVCWPVLLLGCRVRDGSPVYYHMHQES